MSIWFIKQEERLLFLGKPEQSKHQQQLLLSLAQLGESYGAINISLTKVHPNISDQVRDECALKDCEQLAASKYSLLRGKVINETN